jgi:DNA replication protein DnaC
MFVSDALQNKKIKIPSFPGEPKKTCPTCAGLGLIYKFVKDDNIPNQYPPPGVISHWLDGQNPGWYRGRFQSTPCPDCQAGAEENRRRQEYHLSICGLTGADLDVNLASFIATGEFAAKSKAKEAAWRLLEMGTEPAGFVTFYGGYGYGKSHLLKAIVNGFRVRCVMSIYVEMTAILAEIKRNFGQEGKADEVVDKYIDVRVLCIDELDRVNLTDWTQDTIGRMLRARYNNRENVLTVMATNSNPNKLPPALAYLSSRMADGAIIEVPGPQMRGANDK